MFERTSNYPVILVPGVLGYGDDAFASKVLPYFGMTAGSVAKTAKSLGTECYTPTFGTLSGIWDRACELYAQIKGGTVDYGKAHSEKYGTKRYGKTFKGFCPDWGEDGKKVTLIAHGFGAPVARLLVYLMANGSKKEQAAGGELSPLFEGGHPKAVHALVSIAGVNDGMTLCQALEYRIPGTTKALAAGAMAYSQAFSLLHYGFLKNRAPSTPYGNALTPDLSAEGGLLNKIKLNTSALDAYLAHTRDNIFWELSLDGMEEFNKCVSINPDTYYFAYTGEVTRDYGELLPDKKVLGKHDTVMVARDTTKKSIVLPKLAAGITAPTSALISTFKNYIAGAPLVTEEMAPNDGLVNTNTSMAPSTEPSTEFSSVYECEPGIWYQMPIEDKNHLRFLGLGVRPDTYRNEVYDLLEGICNLIEE